MLTLAFDTSSKTASVAILHDDIVIYDVIINSGLNHSEVLLPAIDLACSQSHLKIQDIDLFACTLGPGSFTGLRIGVSTLKGLMIATGKPAVGVSALKALALNITRCQQLICSMMDAGRGQVYIACYQYNEDRLLDQIGKDDVINPQNEIPVNDQDIIFVGDGAIRYLDNINSRKAKNIKIASSLNQYIRATAVGVLGKEKYARNELLDALSFTPFYLRCADAKPGKKIFQDK
jgi:tRNA threonylcarbamoyladenosine biosynthesis protein TsaB